MTEPTEPNGTQDQEAPEAEAQDAPEEKPHEETVSYGRFDDVNTRRKAAEKRVEELEAKQTADAEAALVKNEEWKTLAEQRAEQITTLEPTVARVAELEAALEGLVQAQIDLLPEASRAMIPSADVMPILARLEYISKRLPALSKPKAPPAVGGTQSNTNKQATAPRKKPTAGRRI